MDKVNQRVNVSNSQERNVVTIKNNGYRIVSNTAFITPFDLAKALNVSEDVVLKKYDLDGNGIISSYGTLADELANIEKKNKVNLNQYKINGTITIGGVGIIGKGYKDHKRVYYGVLNDRGIGNTYSNLNEIIDQNVSVYDDSSIYEKREYYINVNGDIDHKYIVERDNNTNTIVYPNGGNFYGNRLVGNRTGLDTLFSEVYTNNKGKRMDKQLLKKGDLVLVCYKPEGADTDSALFATQDGSVVKFEKSKAGFAVTDENGKTQYYSKDGKKISKLEYLWKNW